MALPMWQTATRPSDPNDQTEGFNLTTGYYETYTAATETWAPNAPTGTASVISVSVVTANGISGTVASPTTTPAITLSIATLDNVVIGGTTPAAALFSTVNIGSNASLTNNAISFGGTVGIFFGNGNNTGAGLADLYSDVCIGLGAGALLGTTDSLTTVVGFQALPVWASASGTSFSESTVIGGQSCYNLLESAGGGFCTTLGLHAIYTSTSATHCIAIGTDSLKIGATPSGVIAIGVSSGLNTCDTSAIIIGNSAMICQVGTASTGLNQIIIGHSAFGGGSSVQTTATENIIIGNNIGATTVTTANSNVIIGAQACPVITTDTGNVVIGNQAGNAMAGTSNNVVIGFKAGYKLTGVGAQNVIIGYEVASTTLTTGLHNILIGVSSNCDVAAGSTSNVMVMQGQSATSIISATATNGTPLVTMAGGSLTLGVASTTGGTLILEGSTSGSVTLTGGTTGLFTTANIGNGASALTISGSGQWTANGTTATTMTSLGPTGSHATIQTWLTVTDNGGTVRYIPCY
jgi:trimeric autotransporter adhesin